MTTIVQEIVEQNGGTPFAPVTGSADWAKLRELSDNAWDIGMVSGVIQGIALTPTLLPNQKDALAKAREAIERIGARNHAAVVAIANPPNGRTEP